MKLCQKCLNNMPCYFEGANWDEIDGYAEKRPVDESICEFWAHHKLNDFDELEYGKGYLDHSHNSQTRKGGDMGR